MLDLKQCRRVDNSELGNDPGISENLIKGYLIESCWNERESRKSRMGLRGEMTIGAEGVPRTQPSWRREMS